MADDPDKLGAQTDGFPEVDGIDIDLDDAGVVEGDPFLIAVVESFSHLALFRTVIERGGVTMVKIPDPLEDHVDDGSTSTKISAIKNDPLRGRLNRVIYLARGGAQLENFGPIKQELLLVRREYQSVTRREEELDAAVEFLPDSLGKKEEGAITAMMVELDGLRLRHAYLERRLDLLEDFFECIRSRDYRYIT